MADANGVVQPLAREDIPEDLSGVAWRTLQATAKTLGLNPIQKREALEASVNLELGRPVSVPEVVEEPEDTLPEPVSATEGVEQALAEVAPPRPHFDVGTLPNLAMGEAPPEPEPVPESAPAPQPKPRPAPVADVVTYGSKPPVMYHAHAAKLVICVKIGRAGRYDENGSWIEGVGAKNIEFGKNGNPLYAFRATEQWQVDAIERSAKYTHGACWRADRELAGSIAQKEAELAALKAMRDGGDSVDIAERLAAVKGEVQIVTGARTTRSGETANRSDFQGLGALVQSNEEMPTPGGGAINFGAAARDALRHAEAKGEIGADAPLMR